MKKDLHQKFLDYLLSIFSSKRELTSGLVGILKIEKESVVRRLNGSVLFTVKEVGQIAEKLDISIDYLLKDESESVLLPVDLITPMDMESNDFFIRIINRSRCQLEKISKLPALEIGHIFTSLPVEFFMPYEHLSKFIYFKRMFYFLKENFYESYADWKLPEEIGLFHKTLKSCWNNSKSLFYIWDNPVIYNLVKEIAYLHRTRVLGKEELTLIKQDLHSLLSDVETRTKIYREDVGSDGKPIDLYISNVNIGSSCSYFSSPEISFSYYGTPFSEPSISDDIRIFNAIYAWINSMKRMSTLVSGSGTTERYPFFEEQHKIVDSLE